MKKIIFRVVYITAFALLMSGTVSAQGMIGYSSSSPDNAAIQIQQQEEQEGKKLLDNLNNKIITCSQINDSDFERIGEYFIGQSIGDVSRHIVMNDMMKRMMGEKGEEQAHIAMGKRLPGCDTSANVTGLDGSGWLPMMQMMMREWSSPFGSNQLNNSMMNFGFAPFGIFGLIFMILWWALIIAGIVALIKWLANQSRGACGPEKSALDILKERYARGEIDKKEFEERKKDLS